MVEKSWMLVKEGTQLEGKFSDKEVLEMMQTSPQASLFVWKEGLSQWTDPTTLPNFQGPPPEQTTQPNLPLMATESATPSAPSPQTPKTEPADKFKEGSKAFLEGAAAQFGKIRDAKESHSYLPHLKLLDWFIGLAGEKLSQNLLDLVDDWAKKLGNICLILAAVFLFIGMVVAGIKSGDYLMAPGMGLVFVLVLCLAQYVAIKFLDGGKTLIQKSPSRLSSHAILECVALLALLSAIATLGGGIFMAIGTKAITPLLAGLGASLVLLYLAGTALNSEVVNVKVAGDASAGEEAIGIYAFLLKVHLRLVPFVYGVGLFGLAALLGYLAVTMPFKDEFGIGFANAQISAVGIQVLMMALMPFAIYLAVLFLYLFNDVIRAILIIPSKLDKLK